MCNLQNVEVHYSPVSYTKFTAKLVEQENFDSSSTESSVNFGLLVNACERCKRWTSKIARNLMAVKVNDQVFVAKVSRTISAWSRFDKRDKGVKTFCLPPVCLVLDNKCDDNWSYSSLLPVLTAGAPHLIYSVHTLISVLSTSLLP